MKAIEANLLKFLKKSSQFVIPIYQRHYAWTQAQCQQLWADVLRAGRSEAVHTHFLGSVVYIERGLSNVMQSQALLVIDGQQRLTTTTLLLAALANHFEIQGIPELLEAFSAKKLRNYYLLNPDEEGERHFKLILSDTDKDTLLAILQNTPLPAEASTRIVQNYALFQAWIATTAGQGELAAICQGLAKLVIVDVSLDRGQDNPQLIFESMNSTGLDLNQADLIRNYLLMGLEPHLQRELYTRYWRPMERAFGQAAYVQHFDAFMRHYLTTKTGDIPNVREVHAAFKTFARSFAGDIRALVADIHTYAMGYAAMALGQEKHPELRQAFHDVRELKVDVAYPFLLEVYHGHQQGEWTAEAVLEIVRLVESYVFRRAICGIPTNSLNQTFANFGRSLHKNRCVESVKAAFLLLRAYRRFPVDEEFQRDLKVRDLYHFRSRSYWLRRLENHGRKERVAVEDYTVEHILPQNDHLSPEWQAELGDDWQRVQRTWLHTLGNLTLTGYNSEYSDRPFAYKRDGATSPDGYPIGLAHSPLKLNRGLGQVVRWDEVAIQARAEHLAREALKVWPAPQLADEVLSTYRPAATKPPQPYGVADHPYLVASGPVRGLFEALRRSILALNPCVTEEFFKLYVAYKADTHFVDVMPQAKRLCLMLNMPFHDIDDPKNRCVDVTRLGRWGNGDVEVTLASVAELPYVMGLIRQSLNHQMGHAQDV